jgi:hypothetical protein
VRSLHASYGFEQRVREHLEQLIKECQRQQEEIDDLRLEVDALKVPAKA